MARIKICGLFRDCDIDYVNEARPDYIGFVFAQSRRQVGLEQARQMRGWLDRDILPVGVFVDAPVEQIIEIYREGIISMAQLHGQEDDAYIQTLIDRCGILVIQSVAVKTTADILRQLSSPADYLLLDNIAGGSGHAFDWQLIPAMDRPYFLAGGIDEAKMPAALARQPFGIDISSGAETQGLKDRDKIRRLLELARRADGGQKS